MRKTCCCLSLRIVLIHLPASVLQAASLRVVGFPLADYREDRTVEALLKWLKQKVDFEARTREWEKSHGAQFHDDQEEHPGCMLSGFVLVRVCQPTC